MDDLRKEIESRFAHQTDYAAYQLKTISQDYPGWVMRSSYGEYGVAVEYEGVDISEDFAGAFLSKRLFSIKESDERSYLFLSCHNNNLRNQFSVLCSDFLEPGPDGSKRNEIINDPLVWWERWKELLGNKEAEDIIYDIIGELSALLKLCVLDRTDAFWTASQMNTHDIEMEDMSYEVKSSIKKEISKIHVSSQFQLKSEKPLFLVFTRLEESKTGDSIDDLLTKLSHYQYEKVQQYNEYLEKKGLKSGNHGRKRKFRILERRKYIIDESFPLVRDDLFKAGKLPEAISHLEYDLSLTGIDYEKWD